MGSRLREALRRLCVEIGWSYAVFWKPIRFSNQIQLVWGDGHCDRASGVPAISGYDAMDLLLKEKMALRNSSHLGFRLEDRLTTLVHKLMVPQVHAVGDGIVGEAALMGNHRWILKENPNDYGCALKALTELKQQFWAGIQTIAIIPLLPHGVVQLGSTKMVMEDVRFINHVRCMFAQLASDTGIPFPGIMLNNLTQKSLVHNSNGVPVSIADNINSTQAYGKSSAVDGTLIKRTSSCSMIPPNETSQQMFDLDLHSNICFDMQLENEQFRSLLGVHNSGVRSSNNLLPNDSRSTIKNCSFAETSDSCRLMHIEKELLSLPSDGSLDPANSDLLMLDGTTHVLLESDEFNSNSMLFLDKSKLTDDFKQCSSLEVPEIQKFDGSVDCEVLSVDMQPSNTTSVNRKLQNMSIAENMKEKNSLQPLDITLTESDQHFSCFQLIQGDLHVCCPSNKNAIQGKSSCGDVCLEKGTCSAINKSHTEVPDSPELLHVSGEKKLLVSSQVPEGNDLFDALGLEYERRSLVGSPLELPPPSRDVSACITERDASSLIDAMDKDVTCSGLLPEAEPDELLDAIISRINYGGKNISDNGLPCKSSLVKIESSSFLPGSTGYVSGSSVKSMLGKYVDVSPVPTKTEVPASNRVKSESTDKTEGGSQRDLGYKSQIGLWTGNGQSVASDGKSAGHCKRVDEIGKTGRKRSRPGENPRPRPKDRQMIQDRIKELREIVPNGAKCSIDALLEKTIKHMLFLQSVAKHADKLKETVEPKIISKEGAVLLKDNFEGGATWAFEVGTRSMACPIIVEDLSSPRQMLIEMLCKERGLFLEIADQIRGLGLTILKGVMEVRKDKIWARFAVEANRDVTRMEIFLSLVHLLEPAAGSSISPKGVENISLPHSTFTPSIPATGFSDCLR